jgi:uncharacterized alpha/beta hydrolase family protein
MLGEFEQARENQDKWFRTLKQEIESLSKKYNLKVKEIVRHDEKMKD